MSRNRQDGWTKAEDELLAITVLKYIRIGKTQLEAFKKVANQLSRTPAACGFRWNAAVRKQYVDSIEEAKLERKQFIVKNNETEQNINHHSPVKTVNMAISLLEKMKEDIDVDTFIHVDEAEDEELVIQLKNENKQLKKLLKLYQDGWTEMNKVWEWIQTQHNKHTHPK